MKTALPGSVWIFGQDSNMWACVVVVGDLNRSNGNYPCIMLACSDLWLTRPGQKMHAAVTTAKSWEKVT